MGPAAILVYIYCGQDLLLILHVQFGFDLSSGFQIIEKQ